jgi:biotin carboxylase
MLLVVGAGKFQVPAIVTARKMGLKVVTTDLNPNAPGFKLADYYRVVDVKDEAANLKVAKEFKVDGVIGICSELSVRTVSWVTGQLGLPGLKYDAAVAATDKAVMRTRFKQAGLPSPEFAKVTTLKEARETILNLGLPVVMKPTDSSGSRGVTKIEDLSALESSFTQAKAASHSGDIIVEQFMEGTEMTVEGLSSGGKHRILAMSDKKRIPFPYCVSIDLTYPPHFSRESLDKTRDLIISALDALGINMGASHSEVMMTAKGPIPVETAARGGGYGIFTDIIPAVCGIDVVTECINMALGNKVDMNVRYSRAAVLRFFNLPQGKLLGVSGLEEAKAIEGVRHVELDLVKGDIIKPIISDGTRHGVIITFGDTRDIAVNRADQVEKTVKFNILE